MTENLVFLLFFRQLFFTPWNFFSANKISTADFQSRRFRINSKSSADQLALID